MITVGCSTAVLIGNLLDLAHNGTFDLIIHGCNCQHRMGAGIALELARRWPDVAAADQAVAAPQLGQFSTAVVHNRYAKPLMVCNAYTQVRPGRDARVQAIEQALQSISAQYDDPRLRIGYPLIGCGLGGLGWDEVGPVVNRALAGRDHTLVLLSAKA